MATGVGLRIADDECLAAIVTGGGGEPGDEASEPNFVVRESVLHMAEDGDTTLGGDPPAGPSHSITGFAAAVGDPAGISVDEGEAYRAEDLLATALFCLIDLAAAQLSGPAEFYAVHPADWPAAQVLALRDALDYLGLRSVVLISEAILPGAHTGREYAAAAARDALAAVLSTPAGTTPPDPSHAENPLEATDVLPAIREPMAQAYSAAIPVDRSAAAAPAPAPTPAAEPTATRVAPAVAALPPSGPRRTPMLIAAAAAVGLLLGGIAVALVLGSGDSTPAPTVPDARSDLTPTSQPTTTTHPPTTIRHTPAPAVPQPPVRRTVTPPTTTTTPPPTTTPRTTTPTYPTVTAPPSDTPYPSNPWDAPPSQSPYFPYTFDPYPTFPTAPTYGFPSSGFP
ncbi:Hsp70 family protein [Nocardia macrotermitis]|uniref:Uncharacterized protein n=1 Tax=Nocardia macrotermitis TaxID=2585198 RepID=A0A7K0DEG2_9NOCA|nr:hypothetical protein [Nocardia macrotermitis]MQY24058.1 hypothetical protein [Nocardia macrotermitis]